MSRLFMLGVVGALFLGLTLVGPLSTRLSEPESLMAAALSAKGDGRLLQVDGDPIHLPEGLLLTGLAGERLARDGGGDSVLFWLSETPSDQAAIFVQDCPDGMPDHLCSGQQRVILHQESGVIAGLVAHHFESEYRLPTATGDGPVWSERQSILRLPSGRRIGIVAQVMKGSGHERALWEAHQRVLAGVGQGTD